MMSIATVSPEKYRLQDLVCVETMLRFAFASEARFTVESGVEDADLRVGSGAEVLRYEFQVKGEDRPVTSGALGKWLLHSPPLASGDTALERLMREPALHFVLVALGRCADDIAPLRVSKEWDGQSHDGVPRTTVTAVIHGFSVADPDATHGGDLHTARLAHRDAVAAALKVRAVAGALKRVIVIDEVTAPTTERLIDERLMRRGMPLDLVADTRLAMLAVVHDARGDGEDVLGRLTATLQQRLPTSVASPHYVDRGPEMALSKELELTFRLLLSGVGRSGKSTTARQIGARLEDKGFSVRRFTDVDVAAAFLEDPAASLRLAILDDPLDWSRHPATGTLARLGRLVGNTRPDRRLIVAQGQEILLEAAGATRLDEVSSAGARWHDLGRPTPEFLVSFWRDASRRNEFPEHLVEPVAAWLAGGGELGVGALDLLARMGDQLSPGEGVDSAIRLAERDARVMGQSLRSRLASPSVATALAMSSTAQENVTVAELVFVQGGGGNGLPSYADFDGRSSTLGVWTVPARPLPAYDSPPATDMQTRADLGLLARLHVIDVDRTGSLGLSHSFYRHALATTAPSSPFEVDDLLSMHRRALFSRSGATTKAAARNLDLLLDLAGSTDDGRRRAFGQAIEGLKSYFLATRDICFEFLLRHAAEIVVLDAETCLDAWVRKVTFVNLHELQWHGDDAIHPIDGEVGFSVRGFRARPRSAVAPTLLALAGDDPLPSPREAAEAIGWFASRPSSLSAFQVERLLSFEEGILRAETARAWLSRPREGDEAVFRRIARDEHPLTAIGTLKGIRAGLRDCGAGRRDRLSRLLVELVSRPAGALAVMDDLIVFERDRLWPKHRSRDMRADWTLFASIVPTVLQNLPVETSFDMARFLNVFYEAMRYVPPRSVVRMCGEWLDWLLRMAEAGRPFGDFEVGVLPVVIRATAGSPDLRGDLVGRSLSTRRTRLLVRFIADAVDAWDHLSPGERRLLMGVLDADAVDARWRQAVALTRRVVPGEIQAALLPAGVSLADAPGTLRSLIPAPLLRACLSVHCGQPSAVAAVSRRDRDSAWEAVTKLVAVETGSPMIEIVFSHLAAEEGGSSLADMVREGASRVPDEVFLRLMGESIHRDRERLAPAWEALFAAAPNDATRARWYDEVARAAARLFDDVDDVNELLSHPRDAGEIVNRLRADFALAGVVVNHERAGRPASRWNSLLTDFEALLDRERPALHGFFDRYVQLLHEQGAVPVPLDEKLKETRAWIFEMKMTVWRRFYPRDEIEDWIA